MVAIDKCPIERTTETAKQKAHRETTLAEMSQQVNTMIGDYFDLHSLSIDPKSKRESNTTEGSEASSALSKHSIANRASKHPIANRACRWANTSDQ